MTRMGVVIWWDGKLRGEREAVATAVDHGLTVGVPHLEDEGPGRGRELHDVRAIADLALGEGGL